ncbi:MAG: hypothetical protein AAF203_06230 [Pseudomonadota bacterium]
MIQELDLYFPFIILAYGLVMTIVTNSSALEEKAFANFDAQMVSWFYGHKILGVICLFIGGLWSIQRFYFWA